LSYDDEAYVIVSCDNKEKLVSLLRITIAEHFQWLDSIGMIYATWLKQINLITFGTDDEINSL